MSEAESKTGSKAGSNPGSEARGLAIADAPPRYGEGDSSYRAAGERAGLTRLVDAFYRIMDEQAFARIIRRMHPRDLTVSRDKLTRFLCGWLNGPALFNEKYGPIRIPSAHAHLRVGPRERDAWLRCMELAIAEQDFAPEFATYLLEELRFPAQRVLETSRDPLEAEVEAADSPDSADSAEAGDV